MNDIDFESIRIDVLKSVFMQFDNNDGGDIMRKISQTCSIIVKEMLISYHKQITQNNSDND